MANFPNPIATQAQAEFEKRALRVIEHTIVNQAITEVRESWPKAVNASRDMMQSFQAAFDEVVFGAAIWSLNTDKERPAVITISRLPHRLDGLDIPGSRWGLDNPDSVYRVIPISGKERYVIRGRVPDARVSENYFSLWDDKFNSVAVFNGKDIKLNPDNSFEITVDSSPANGRANHIQSTPDAHEFYIRDVVQDWKTEMINELAVTRLGGAPRKPPLSDDEQAELTASFLRRFVRDTPRWNSQALDKPVNTFEFKIDRDTDGAQRSQIYIMGHFKVAEDEAFVVNVGMGGAGYFICPITNWWGTTNDIMDKTGSLNRAQSVANRDGTYTFVISKSDPGVHNWVDPSGMGEGILTLRWAEFDGGKPGDDLGAQGKIVKLANLRAELPKDTKFVSAAERQVQLKERAASYAWRLG